MWSGYQVNSSEHHVKYLEELGGDPTQVPILRPHHLIPALWVEREAAAVWEDALSSVQLATREWLQPIGTARDPKVRGWGYTPHLEGRMGFLVEQCLFRRGRSNLK